MIKCTQNPFNPDCLAPYGGPVEPGLALGSFPSVEQNESPDYKLAHGMALTFLVNNKQNRSELGQAMAWEKKFITFLKGYKSDKMDIAFSAERSIEDGIDELSTGEMPTVIISYVVMFIYITFALGKIKSFKTFFNDSKITLAIGGIVIVLASVGCSLGIFGYMNVATTMLTIEVIPFLVLAVGVDNIFMLVHTFNGIDQREHASTADAIGSALGKVGPSILLTSTSEICCFAIGTLSDMPAVNTFALYSTVAILFDFLFQITAFVALMCIDHNRSESQRLDLFCCIKTSKKVESKVSHGILYRMFKKFYTPFILSK